MVAWVLLAVALVLPVIFLPRALAAWSQGEMGAVLGTVIGALAWFLIWGFLSVVAFYITFGMLANRSQAVLKTVTGPIQLTTVERRSNDRYHTVFSQPVLRIGYVGFDVKRELFDRLRQGDNYAVYYVGGTIQSLELSATPGPQPDAGGNDNNARLLELIRRQDKLGAIKLHRELYNSSLAEARGAVEALAASVK